MRLASRLQEVFLATVLDQETQAQQETAETGRCVASLVFGRGPQTRGPAAGLPLAAGAAQPSTSSSWGPVSLTASRVYSPRRRAAWEEAAGMGPRGLRC